MSAACVHAALLAAALIAAPGLASAQAASPDSAANPASPGLRYAPAAQRREVLQRFAQDVVSRLRARLRRGVVYPGEALSNRWEGTTRIAVVYGREGDVQDVVVSESSGHPVLDQAALAVVRTMDLPSAPVTLRGTAFDVTFPIEFRLQVLPVLEP